MSSSLTFRKYVLVILGLLTFVGLGFLLKNLKTTTHNNLKVVLLAKVLQDDMFQLFYEEVEKDGFSHKKTVDVEIIGNNKFQEITFMVPKIASLNRLRLDIGNNKNQNSIIIRSIRFSLDEQDIIYDVEAFNRLFKPNNYVKKIDKNGTFKGLSAMRKNKKIFDPYFSSRRTSNELIAIRNQPFIVYPFLVSAFITVVLFLFIFFNIGKIKLTKEAVFIVLFFMMLTLPVLQNTFKLIEPGKNLEKRKLASRPQFRVSEYYPKQFETFFDDNFGLRNYLINFGGAYRTKLFRSSIHPELVKFGKQDWLYYNRIDGKIFKSYTHTNLISKDTLQRIVKKWEQNKINYESKGAKYFLTFWPNKHTVYPEYLPETMSMQIKDTVSRIDQILSFLENSKSSIKLFDSRLVLINGKNENQLYHKFDTHWNDYGAFLGYQGFFNDNFDKLGINPKTLDDFKVEWNDFKKGELIQMLGVKNDGYFKESTPNFTLKKDKDQIEFLSTKGYPKQTKITRNRYCGNKLKVLVFRDSYTTKLIQFYSLHFYEVTYIWGHGEKYVDLIKPDIVIEGYVERSTAEKIQ
ncbi:alginate O-acetyltransferase AlgX-related protein [Maribacter sp. IgM3_T14_3]|uniref:alginate O-acetyltransferase AlgX-related protein n=1 Tax=Maribacter sp. IgM3_T14_3 TaxID=3415140 RepID=UPI003C6F67D2